MNHSKFSNQPEVKLVGLVDYKQVDDLRRAMTPNGKMLGRKRTGMNSEGQKKLAAAIKRARFLALLPYTDASH
ncbi:MAG: 30S ribosomal protein S18 [Planctomycetota bacterium]|nr:30S ribosomal protein S18 [Planctomycetota bacterium]